MGSSKIDPCPFVRLSMKIRALENHLMNLKLMSTDGFPNFLAHSRIEALCNYSFLTRG
jgi:hypothetical protein